MKKILVTLLILVAVVGAVSASDGRIGVSVAPEWLWHNDKESGVSTGQTSLAFMADGAHYFGKKGSGIGIEYGLGAYFPLSKWSGDTTVKIEDTSGFVFKIGVGYRYEFSDLFGLAAGIGTRGCLYSSTEDVPFLGTKVTTNMFSLDIYGDVTADITLLDFLRINVGVMLGGPVYAKASISTGGESFSGDSSDISGFWLAPVIAVSYTY